MEKIWLKSYPPGVPADVDIGPYPSLAQLLADACRRYGSQVAFISMGRDMSYQELDELSSQFAGWLQSRGLGRGQRVAIMMPNVLQYPVALFGALRAGCVVVNCNPLYTPRELEHQLKDSGAEAIVILENFAATLEQVIDRTRIRHVVVTSLGAMLGMFKGNLVNFAVRHIKKMVPAWSLPGSIDMAEALATGRRQGTQAVTLGHHDMAFLQYTGGTTGVSKGAVLTHGNVLTNVMQVRAWLAPALADGQELIVTALPLYHIFALTVNCLALATCGARSLLIVNPRDIGKLIKEMAAYPVSVITAVNTLFNALLNHEDFAKLDFSRLKLSVGGGMAVQTAVAEHWQQVTGKTILQGYGLTETSPVATMNPLNLTQFNGSVGLPVSGTEVEIRDAHDEPVPLRQVGEICIRGAQVMREYWQRPGETNDAISPDGYLRSGDLGYMDENGFVYIVDRKKDMILVSGFNVYPNEVEDVVALHPGVSDVAAIGVADEHSGEAVKIFVVRKDPKLTPQDLIAHCRKELTGYKVPKHVEFRDDLPRTNVGKILRRALKEKA